MTRRTKIVATLGPATDQPGVLEGILLAGVNVVRLNFSHGVPQDHLRRAHQVRSIAQRLGLAVGILADLQGPKIRIEKFKNGSVHLQTGQDFILDSTWPVDAGDALHVGISYKELVHDVKAGDILLLDDGKIVLEVQQTQTHEVHTVVKVGGILSDRKGINLQGGGLSAPALTEKDKADLAYAAEFKTDFIAVSFVRSADDIHETRALLKNAGSEAAIIAKVERTEALGNIDEIIMASDGIMIARGDLAVEIGDAKLVGVQKRFIKRARQLKRVVITATQMMESMIENASPTRAEVLDVANAVLDGTDAVMLSAESAAGKYPVETVKAMAQICEGAESEVMSGQFNLDIWSQNSKFERTDEAIALSAIFLANHYNIQAVVCLTETGTTAILMSRVDSSLPIFGLTRHQSTCGRLTLCKGVHPVEFHAQLRTEDEMIEEVVKELKAQKAIKIGDKFLFTRGALNHVRGGTNSLRIVLVE